MSPRYHSIAMDGGLTATVNSFGAELSALQTFGGVPLLWSGEPSIWSGRAPILFPIVGRLHDGRYRYKGRAYTLGKHGFARTSQFTTVKCTSTDLILRLSADAATRAVYPFDFVLDIAFSVGSRKLTIIATVSNIGDETMPMSFGFHPAFRWPLDPTLQRDACAIFVDVNDPVVRRLTPDGLLGAPQPGPFEGERLDLADELFVDDALIFAGLASRHIRYRGSALRTLIVEPDNLPDLGIWSKPGAGFICIEPWHGHDDPAAFAGDIFDKPGIVVLAPGERWTASMTIWLEDA